MELTREKLQEMAAVDIRNVDINTLADLRDIVVDMKKPVPEKLTFIAMWTNYSLGGAYKRFSWF